MKERLIKLIDVKTIVILVLVGVLCITTLLGKETNELFNSSVMLVLGFFFGKNLSSDNTSQTENNNGKDKDLADDSVKKNQVLNNKDNKKIIN